MSRLTRVLEEQVRAFHQAPLDDDWAYLILDGVWIKVRRRFGPQRALEASLEVGRTALIHRGAALAAPAAGAGPQKLKGGLTREGGGRPRTPAMGGALPYADGKSDLLR